MDDSATKFGGAIYLSYFFRNYRSLERRFEQITLKKIAKPYTVSHFCMEISLAISLGSCPFSKINTELLFELKIGAFYRLRSRIFHGQKGS
jgi:hypothetical protein